MALAFVTIRNGKAFVDHRRISDATKRQKLLDIPNVSECRTGGIWFPFTTILHRRLTKIFGEELQLDGDSVAIKAMKERAERFELAHRYRDAEELPDVPSQKMSAWNHQRRGFWFSFHMQSCVLSEKMGAGKTKQIFDVVCNEKLKKILVVTTASAVDDWVGHSETHSTLPYNVLCCGEKMRTVNSAKKAQIVEAAFHAFEYLIVVVSYETVWRAPFGMVIKNRLGGAGDDIGILSTLGFDAIVPDEIHKIADPMSRAGLFLWRLGAKIPKIIGATGTVIRHKPENAFGIYRMIDSALLGNDYQKYLDRYCIFNRPSNEQLKYARGQLKAGLPCPAGVDEFRINSYPERRFIVGYKNLDELGRLLSTVTYHVDNVNLDLPKPIHVTRNCYLSPKGQKHYNELEESLLTVLDDGTEIVTTNKLTSMLRMRQATGGFIGERVIDPETGETADSIIHEIDKAKEELLAEVLEEIGPDEPVIVVGVFKHDMAIIRRVCEAAGRRFYEQSGRKKERIAWQQAKGGEVLGAQIQSACEAIDLTRSSYMIFYSIGFSVFQYLQMLARIDRPGQTRRPTYSHLVAHGTIDVKVYRAIQKLIEISEEIVTAMKQPIASMVIEEYRKELAA